MGLGIFPTASGGFHTGATRWNVDLERLGKVEKEAAEETGAVGVIQDALPSLNNTLPDRPLRAVSMAFT